MSLDTFQTALSCLHAVGISEIRLTGGEPTIHPQFLEFVAHGNSAGLQVGVVTNGSALTKHWWTHGFQASLSRCWVSLYGFTAQDHASVSRRPRGAQEFVATLTTVGALSRHHLNIGIGVSLLPGGSKHARAFFQLARKEGVRKIRILPMQREGRAAWEYGDNLSFESEVRQLSHELRSWPELRSFEVVTINDMFDLEDAGARGMRSCLLNHRRMPAMTPSGDVYYCCYNAYEAGARMGNLTDLEHCTNRLRNIVRPSHCKAFDVPANTGGICRCPIGNISLLSSK